MAPSIGFIGLGTIGFPVCLNFARSGVAVTAYDARPREDRIAALKGAGVRLVGSLSEVTRGGDVLITLLPSSDVVEEVLASPEVLDHLRPGQTVIEMSSGYPTTTKRLGALLAQRGVNLVDSPICNGGVPGAYERKIVLCLGGENEVIEKVIPLLRLVSAKQLPIGPLGSAHAFKIINNSISHAYGAVIAEGLALGVAYGIELQELFANLEQCSASASFTQIGKPMTRPPTEDVKFQLYLGTKDLRYSTELAGQLGSPHGVTDAAHATFEIAERAFGLGVESMTGPWRLFEKLGSR